MAGYNIQCDQGSLYYRKCYVILASGEKQEIIGYTSGGDPISKDTTDVPRGTAWVPTMTTLDMSGNAYQPYPEGIPYTAGGGSVVNWTPSGGADVSNINTYLNQSMPGATARQMEKDRVCNPLWPTFGCRTFKNKGVPIGTTGGTSVAPTGNIDDQETTSIWESLTSWWSGSAEDDDDDDAEEMQVIEQQIPGMYIAPTSSVNWNKLAIPAVALGGLGLALYADKRMNRGVYNEQY